MTRAELLCITSGIADCIAKSDNKKVVYISGKVTGLSPDVVSKKFDDDAKFLYSRGFLPFNPTAYIKPDCPWQEAMKLCLAILPLCDMIYMQPDADDSQGAIWEEQTADRLGIKIVFAPNFN
jgi:hypothetical protein